MIKYRINGEFLDLFNNKKDFAVTKQVSKIGEINLRHGDFSTSFKIPLTSNNARILRYVPELNNYTDVDSFDGGWGCVVDRNSVEFHNATTNRIPSSIQLDLYLNSVLVDSFTRFISGFGVVPPTELV